MAFQDWSVAPELLLLAFQYPHDGKDRIPIPGGGRRTTELVDLPNVADGLHVPAALSADELLFASDDAYEPLTAGRKATWNRSHPTASFRQDAHETNDIGARGRGCEWAFVPQADKVPAVAERNYGFER